MDRLSPQAAKEFAVKAARIEDVGELFDLLCDALAHVRGHRVAYFHFPPFGADPKRDMITIAYQNFPDELADGYLRNRLWMEAPDVLHALNNGMPFRVDQMPGLFDRLRTETDPDVLQTGSGFKALLDGESGIGFGAFGPQGREGYFVYFFERDQPPLTFEHSILLQAMGNVAHIKYCRLREAEGYSDSVHLSGREIKALTQVALGMPRKVIGERMRLPETTVRSILRSSAGKLGIQGEDMTSAAIRAIALGQVKRIDRRDDLVAVRTPGGRQVVRLP
jgi:DNA-binding CsgD family transcriptional regulator